MQCPSCHTDNDDAARFCRGCGSLLQAGAPPVLCPKCAAPIKPAANFCTNCGSILNLTPDAIASEPVPEPPEPAPAPAEGVDSARQCPVCGKQLPAGATDCPDCTSRAAANETTIMKLAARNGGPADSASAGNSGDDPASARPAPSAAPAERVPGSAGSPLPENRAAPIRRFPILLIAGIALTVIAGSAAFLMRDEPAAPPAGIPAAQPVSPDQPEPSSPPQAAPPPTNQSEAASQSPAPAPEPAPAAATKPVTKPATKSRAVPKTAPQKRETAAKTPAPTAVPADTPQEASGASNPAVWLTELRAKLKECEQKDFFSRAVCAEKVRWQYCNHRWNSVPECQVGANKTYP